MSIIENVKKDYQDCLDLKYVEKSNKDELLFDQLKSDGLTLEYTENKIENSCLDQVKLILDEINKPE